MAQAGDDRSRPLSPHLQIWRWHATMAASILHRVTGVGLYVAAVLMVAWLIAVAAGPLVYGPFDWLVHSWFGQICAYGAAALVTFHAANGVRHLFWDAGKHFDPKRAEGSAWLVVGLTILLPTLLWVGLTLLPRLFEGPGE